MDSRFFQVLVVVVTFVVLNTCFAQVRRIDCIECRRPLELDKIAGNRDKLGDLGVAKVPEAQKLHTFSRFLRKILCSEVIIIEQVGVDD